MTLPPIKNNELLLDGLINPILAKNMEAYNPGIADKDSNNRNSRKIKLSRQSSQPNLNQFSLPITPPK